MVVVSCKKNYAPHAISSSNSNLVVEGTISAGGDSTIIKLSRTIAVSGLNKVKHETGAKVTVNDDQGTNYPLVETDSGRYTAAPFSLDTARKYRLNIITADGKTYASDYTPVKVTPPIDTLNYDITAAGVNFYASTHDPTGRAKYYRWDYTETYIYESNVEAPYVFDNSYLHVSDKFRARTPAQQIHVCYISRDASTILLRSTSNLSRDVILNNPITQIASTSEKLNHRYSILLKQYALTSEAYDFWTQMKKNTEQIGNIFDPQPSDIQGNIHCTSNPSEPVIGYVSASTVSQKRIFIDNSIIPWYNAQSDSCTHTVLTWDDGNIPSDIKTGVWIPYGQLSAVYRPAYRDSAYAVAVYEYDCVDCRYHNHGSNVKPAFWK